MSDDHSISAATYLRALEQASVTHFATMPDLIQVALPSGES